MKSSEVRTQFLEFFERQNHTIVPSAPMVIKDDPTLMFTNAGMNQFKEYFLGIGTPKSKRIVDTQKCLRVSGKHNDLEEVGKDTYHHTMFEMLGNWSFGDYFKEEAITWAWQLLTAVFNIDKDRLYITVFEGSTDADNLKQDTEALAIWKKIVPEDRILFGNKKDNFWEMGDQGPCGPCSEIHVDIRPNAEREKIPGAALVNKDHPQVVEIWNLVFMQYNRKADGQLENLPAKHVDTGMGFERLCMVLQGVQSSYDSDIFVPIIREIETITNTTYGKAEKEDIAIRVVADHIRAVAFAIADGQLPSNTGAGYVIRRILRRAIRYGFTFLGTKEPFMYRLVKVLTETMGTAFPELQKERQLIENVIKEEEHSFLRTLAHGLVLLDNVLATVKGKRVDGKKAFELYDTFGFPIDLTALILHERGYDLDEKGFHAALLQQKERSRSASEISKEDWVNVQPSSGQDFVGYDTLEADVQLVKYRKINSSKEGEQYQFVLNPTPFYPEGGGQVGDKGYLEFPNGDVVYIEDTKRENNEIIHFSKNLPEITKGSVLRAIVDKKQRQRTACNHTATHLLHQGLREILGVHVAQKGSAVNSKYLRFDFSHFAKLSVDELRAVENFVNARIEGQLPMQEKRNILMQEALNEGAMALFGEKYGDTVRTVRFGKSIELCGGTHVQNTADIWHFKIKSEGAVAAGIRRIEAITSDAVKDFYFENNRTLYEIKDVLHNAQDPLKSVVALQEENTELKKQLAELLKEKAKRVKEDLCNELEEVNGILFLAKQIDVDAAGIKDLSFEMGQNRENLFLILASDQGNKALLSCYISKELVTQQNFNAATVVRELGTYIQGGGGGQPFFATAGGKHPAGIPNALAKAKDYVG
ncbi:alanine--tRNA ligase [Arenibacter sp. GZD96]|uniref:alanine--tRNA ligase n=1 Tax=Aurantibrevibacter litoralis TaxID=3106030 RepID=UPI002AFFB9CD|nr:alanine--tRNA ligase [Arenibacter sp. GZD-96]MEA1785797.1 alanine--tRNA ligase [Arenibacter sp. GZD-96]